MVGTGGAAAEGAEIRVPVEGGEIVGWTRGSGPPLLLLHGGPGLSDYLGELAAELAPAFRTVRYQQRGVPPSVAAGDRSVEGHVADAVGVLDRLGLARAWVAGHSWGGHLAMHLAVRHPDRVEGIVVIDALGAVPDGGAEALGANLMRRLSPRSGGGSRRSKGASSEARACRTT